MRERLLRWAELYGFKADSSGDESVDLRRGSRVGGWTSFDVHNVPTRLSARFRRNPGGTEVTISLVCASWGLDLHGR